MNICDEKKNSKKRCSFSFFVFIVNASVKDVRYYKGEYIGKTSINMDHVTTPETNPSAIWHFDEETGCLSISNDAAMYYRPWQSIKDSIQSIVIENGVTTIGNCAFENCISLTNVSIPDSVTTIEDGAFSSCSSLTSVTIPNSVLEIGNSAFSGCSSLTSVTIPNGVLEIGNSAFSGCSSLTSVIIPNGITRIGQYMFYECASLTSISLPNTVTTIGEYAFAGCVLLSNIAIPNCVTSIGGYAFARCFSLSNITIPNSVTSIGEAIFGRCTSLERVELSDNLSSISMNAFFGCSLLSSVTIPSGVISIAPFAFEECTALTNIHIPDSVTSIDSSAFSYCTSLTSVTIGNGVTSIGNGAFRDCTSLTSIEIPDSVTSIGYEAFNGCTSLTSVTIGNGVTSIGNWAFYDCSSLEKIIFCGTEDEWNAVEKELYWNSANIPVVFHPTHTWNDGESTTPATHTTTGVKTYICTECDAVKTEEIPMTEVHSHSSWQKHDAEQHKKVCECDDVQYGNHTWNDGVVTTEPTETTEGVKIFTCTDCGETKTETVEKLPATSNNDGSTPPIDNNGGDTLSDSAGTTDAPGNVENSSESTDDTTASEMTAETLPNTSGCGGSLNSSYAVLALLAILGFAFVAKKKENE